MSSQSPLKEVIPLIPASYTGRLCYATVKGVSLKGMHSE